jgi:hypothetical protein
MYKEAKLQNLFDNDLDNNRTGNEIQTKNELSKQKIDYQDVIKSKTTKDSSVFPNTTTSEVVKIVWFYENNSFEEFFPRR